MFFCLLHASQYAVRNPYTRPHVLPDPFNTPAPPSPRHKLLPGQRVRVTQQILRQAIGGGTFTGSVEGIIIKFEQQKTGSWFAHSRDGKLWLDRLELRKDDGELITLNIDQFTHIEWL